MNRAHYRDAARQIDRSVVFVPPKNRTELSKWLKAVRKALPEVPLVSESGLRNEQGWYLFRKEITEHHIMLEFHLAHDNTRSRLAIERRSALYTK